MSAETGAAARTPHDAHAGPWTSYSHGLPETAAAADYSSYTTHAPPQPPTWPANPLELSRINTSAGAWRTYPAATRSLSYSDDPYGGTSSSSPTTRAYTRHAPLATDDGSSLSAGAAAYGSGGTWAQPSYSYSSGAWYGGEQHSPEAHVSSAGAEDPSHLYYSGR